MKVNRLSLDEMLWEITLKCNKSCSYCGSKELLQNCVSGGGKKIDEKIWNIAREIVKYPPKALTITGGEPIMIGEDLFDDIVGFLVDNGIVVNVLSNGEIFKYDVLENINRVGLSINTLEDVENYNKTKNNLKSTIEMETEVVMITNFGTHNIWEFDKLSKCFTEGDFVNWQVQLTIGNELQLGPDGIKYLRDKLESFQNDLRTNEFDIVVADNLQEVHECMAGMNSCSILESGDVVRCLSQRTYVKEADDMSIYGNVLDGSKAKKNFKSQLQYIFEDVMNSCRFCNNTACCRDEIDYPYNDVIEEDSMPNALQKLANDWNTKYEPKIIQTISDYDKEVKNPFNEPTVFVYGVNSIGSSSSKWKGGALT